MTREEIAKKIKQKLAVMNYAIAFDEQDWRSILTALTAPGEGTPPPVCTGSLTHPVDAQAMSSALPTHGKCGVCGQRVPLQFDGTGRITTHGYLAAPAPQEQAQCPSCDGLRDTAGCTCPAPPAREGRKFCVCEDCDGEPLYCSGHAQQFVRERWDPVECRPVRED